ncbi:serine hydrolase domain-containing protein [Asticcacaulis sp. AND118]|uniref:serine hydrolase domain-containing protein n=1 Tax=Asticcacaulis sp. AND118 TaxID=2840468 RepID=UPI001CFF8ED4|nr:serine hydrolase domain-containing protein [Asticcacaulis sp. AND118]UDF03741.1 beta-lactamase family protein [Asticcacaulis sp. AND118]
MPEINGTAPARFAAVKDRFAQNFVDGPDGLTEKGARFTVVQDEEVILDLWGGVSNREGTAPFTDATLTPVFSSTKAVTALMIARLVDQGKLDYNYKVSVLWPEFGRNGKDGITLGQLISHQGGLSGFSPPIDPATWFDIPALLDALCEQTPLWTPGEGSGYHPITIGYLMGEVFRRADGRTLGTALREDIATPFGLDLMIGTPEAAFPRISDMWKPTRAPDLGPLDPIKQAAFLDKGSSPAGRGSADWRKMEIPSANGHATAEALARLMQVVANGGRLKGGTVLTEKTLNDATKERVSGPDRVLPFDLSWGAGFLRNKGIHIYGPNARAIGHSGWGGSCVMADPDKRLSIAYVMNRQSHYLIGDPRPVGLINSVYEHL